MALNMRFWQKLQLGTGLVLFALAYLSHDRLREAISLILVACFLAALLTRTPDQRVQAQIEQLQQQGIYPQGQPTDEDVRRVLKAGHKLLAIRLYRELHQVPLKQAVEAIKQMS